MKARVLAVLLSLSAVSLPIYANGNADKQSVKTTATASQRINLNTADVHALTGSFKGIGKKRAEAIVAYRTEHNGFKSIEELAQIKGFSQRFVTTNKEKLNETFVIQ